MIIKMVFRLCLITLVWVTLHRVSSKLQCQCERAKCKEPSDCKAGVRYDMCNCCKVCAKEEGQLCAGPNNVEGQCGDNLQCMVRHLRNNRNRMKKSVQELVGRCEHKLCLRERCPSGKSCYVEDGAPTCKCPRCTDMIDEPVCGLNNNVQYKNECELRNAECQQEKQIGLVKGPCAGQNVSQIKCGEESIRIEVQKSFFGHRKKLLTLLDSNCVMQENKTHVFYTTKLNECGTKASYTLTSVVYSNIIRTFTDPNALIIRHKSIQIPFECDYSTRSRNRIRISARGAIGDRFVEKLRGNGVGVKIRNVAEISRRQRSLDGPLQVDVNVVEQYYVELKAKYLGNKQNTILLPHYCYATPVLASHRWMRYTLVQNGCPVEEGVEIRNAPSPFVRLVIPGIKFRNTKYPGVLVRCKIRACFYTNQFEAFKCRNTCTDSKRKRRDISTSSRTDIDNLLLHDTPIVLP